MNLVKGFLRLTLVLTLIAGIIGYFFNNDYYWDSDYFNKMESKALQQKYNVNCSDLYVAMVTELGTNKKVYFFGKRLNKKDNFVEEVVVNHQCDAIATLIAASNQNIDTPILIGEISDEQIKNYAKEYKNEIFVRYIKSQSFAVIEAITYLWGTLLAIFLSFNLIRWVYKGFNRG